LELTFNSSIGEPWSALDAGDFPSLPRGLPVGRAALLGVGVTLIAVPHALPHLETRAANPAMVFRRRTDLDLLRDAHVVTSQTRVFVDFVVEAFRRNRLAERFAGSLG